jgi:hypothetical protein
VAVTRVGTPATPASQLGSNTPSVTSVWGTGQNRTAGNMLYAWVTLWGGTTAGVISTPAGWSVAVDAGVVGAGPQARVVVFRKLAAGADAAPVFTATNSGTATNSRLVAGLEEFAGADPATPEGASGSVTAAAGTALTMATAGNVPVAGCYAFAACQIASSAAATETWTQGAGFANAWTDGTGATRSHTAQDVNASPSAGAPCSDAGTTTLTIQVGIGVIIAVQPPAAGVLLLPQQLARRTVTRGAGEFSSPVYGR